MKLCRNCGKAKVSRPRGMCWHCYYIPGIRDKYFSTSKFAQKSSTKEKFSESTAETLSIYLTNIVNSLAGNEIARKFEQVVFPTILQVISAERIAAYERGKTEHKDLRVLSKGR